MARYYNKSRRHLTANLRDGSCAILAPKAWTHIPNELEGCKDLVRLKNKGQVARKADPVEIPKEEKPVEDEEAPLKKTQKKSSSEKVKEVPFFIKKKVRSKHNEDKKVQIEPLAEKLEVVLPPVNISEVESALAEKEVMDDNETVLTPTAGRKKKSRKKTKKKRGLSPSTD